MWGVLGALLICCLATLPDALLATTMTTNSIKLTTRPITKPTAMPTDSTKPTTMPTNLTKPSTKPTNSTKPTAKPTAMATNSTKPTTMATNSTKPTTKPTTMATNSTKPTTKPTKMTTNSTKLTTKPTTKPTAMPTNSTKPTTMPTISTKPTTKPTNSTKPTATPATMPTQATKPTTMATNSTKPKTKPTTMATNSTKPTTMPTKPTDLTKPTAKPTDPTKPYSLCPMNRNASKAISYDEYSAIGDKLIKRADNHKQVISVVRKVNATAENRHMYMFLVRPYLKSTKANSTNKKSSFWFEGGLRANDFNSVTLMLDLVCELANRCKGEGCDYNYYFVPLVNPDGYEYARLTNSSWVKNRQANNGSTCLGTNLNRNFPPSASFKTHGTADPCSHDNRGPAPSSAMEVAALTTMKGCASKNSYALSLTLIPTAEQIDSLLWPLAHNKALISENEDYKEIANSFDTTGATAIGPYSHKYLTSGTSMDYSYNKNPKHTYSFTLKLHKNAVTTRFLTHDKIIDGITKMTKAVGAKVNNITKPTTKPPKPTTKLTSMPTNSTKPTAKPSTMATNSTMQTTKQTNSTTKATKPTTKLTSMPTNSTKPTTKPTTMPTTMVTNSTMPTTKATKPTTKITSMPTNSTKPATKPTTTSTNSTMPTTKPTNSTKPTTKPATTAPPTPIPNCNDTNKYEKPFEIDLTNATALDFKTLKTGSCPSYASIVHYIKKIASMSLKVELVSLPLTNSKGSLHMVIVKPYMRKNVKNPKYMRDRKSYYLEGGLVANACDSVTTLLALTKMLAYETPKEHMKSDFYIVPLMNPQGYEYSRNLNKKWVKNQENNKGYKCNGVSLNHNYPPASSFKLHSSACPCDDTYRGLSPGSTEEYKKLMILKKSLIIPTVALSLIPSEKKEVAFLFPKAYSNETIPEYQKYMKIGKAAKDAVVTAGGDGKFYDYMSFSKWRLQSGTSMDYSYEKHGKSSNKSSKDKKYHYSLSVAMGPYPGNYVTARSKKLMSALFAMIAEAKKV